MAQLYFSLVTNIGRFKLAASAAGGPAVTITHFAIGDGNGAETNPTAASTALVREVWRTGVESVETDPLNPAAVLVTALIPTVIGGWWMREFGIFDAAGDMIAVAKPVSQYKPTALEGQLEDIRYEFQIVIGETANVTLLVDPSVLLASRAWVENRKTPINRLNALPWLPVLASLNVPPAAPALGDVYLIAAAPTGAWAGQAGKIAEFTLAGWMFTQPGDGHGISFPDGRVFMRRAGDYAELASSSARRGLVELATSPEAVAGTDNERALTPLAGLAQLASRLKGAKNTAGVPAGGWNDLTAWGMNPILMLGSAEGGPGGPQFFHVWNVVYGDTQNFTQIAVPYSHQSSLLRGMLMRGNYDGVWGDWVPVTREATTALKGIMRFATVAEAKAGVENNSAVTPAGLAAAMPVAPSAAQYNNVYPTVLTADNTVGVVAGPGAGKVTMNAFSFIWRDARTVAVPAQNFNTVASKVYHIRVAYNHVAEVATSALKDLSAPAYNPSALEELDPALDSGYDDVLIARVTTNAANVATIVPLKNAKTLTASAKNTVYTRSAVDISQGWIPSPWFTTNFARTPTVFLSSFNFDASGEVEAANRIAVRVSRTAFQVDCFAYELNLAGTPASASLYGYKWITGIWEAKATA